MNLMARNSMKTATDITSAVPMNITSAHLGILGKTGSGKTYAAKGLVEWLLQQGRRTVIIDPTGVWWGLRSGADGTPSDGYQVIIFGGDHADVPITDADGEALGEMLATQYMSAIVDVSDFSFAGRARFMTAFLGRLYQCKPKDTPIHLVVDEADAVAPQRPMPYETTVLHHMSQIVRRGRVKGFRVMLITQRPATIHKDVITQINALIAMRVTAPQDRRAIEEWIKGQADTEAGALVLASLGKLATGHGWVWYPDQDTLLRVHFPPITTYDSGRSLGDGHNVDPIAVDLTHIAEIRAQFESKSSPRPTTKQHLSPDAIRHMQDQCYENGHSDGYAKGWAEAFNEVRIHLDAIISILDRGHNATAVAKPRPADTTALISASTPKAAQPGLRSNDPLLETAMAVWPVKLTWGALAAACGRKARGGHFNATRKRLIETGIVREEGGMVVLTNPPDTTGAIPADLLEQNLPQPARKMFTTIREHSGLTIEGLAQSLGMQPRGGHWNHGMAVLKQNALIIIDGSTGKIHIPASLEGEA